MVNVLSATLRFSQKYVCPYYDISVGVTLAYYQQAGSDGKCIGISGSGYIDLPYPKVKSTDIKNTEQA